MSILEKLFVQIFDRKNWIVNQLNQQKDLYDQYLASTLLINGIRPPSWLWNAGFEAGSSDLKELKKEDLISVLLFPPPRSNVPSSSIGCNTFNNRSISAANNGQLSDHFFSETCASNKYSEVGERSTVVPKCQFDGTNLEVGCILNGVPEQDNTIISPQHQINSRMSETCFEESLARIQRSRSRQKALELRNSANEKSKKRPRKESCTAVYFGSKALRSGSATQKVGSAERDDDLHNALDTQVTLERSSSGQKDLELCNFVEVNTENHPTKGDTTKGNSGITVRYRTAQPSEIYEGVLVDRESVIADMSPESNKIAIQVSVEALKKVTMSNGVHEKYSSFPGECLLKKDHNMEIGDTEEQLKAYSETHAEEKLELFGMNKAECDLLHPISFSNITLNLTSLSSMEGPVQTSDVFVYRSPESKTLSNQAPVVPEKK